MSFNTKIILNEFLTFTNFKITMENCGLFQTNEEWDKQQKIVKSLPDEETRLFYLEAFINRRISEDHKRECEIKEKARAEREEKKVKDEKEKEEKKIKDEKEKEEKRIKEAKDKEERRVRDEKDRIEKRIKEEKDKEERRVRDEKDKEERKERELRARIRREEVEKIDREACDREARLIRHTLLAHNHTLLAPNHTILAHMGGGVAIGIPVPPIYSGVELRHIGGGSFVPVRKDNSKGGSRVAPGYPLMCHRF